MNRIESTETGPHIHGQLIFNNSVPHAGTTRFAYAKKRELLSIPHTTYKNQNGSYKYELICQK